MSATADIAGKIYGRLTAISFDRSAVGGAMWRCRCVCGNETTVKIGKLTSGWTRSCGCLRQDVTGGLKLRHGQARSGQKTLTYMRWKGMISRCYNLKHKSFKNYGGRGIKVCKRWRNSFGRFFRDMGAAPIGKVLDRRNNNGNYTPKNCRWTSYITSGENKRSTIWVDWDGEKKSLSGWSRKTGIKLGTILQRFKKGRRGKELFKR